MRIFVHTRPAPSLGVQTSSRIIQRTLSDGQVLLRHLVGGSNLVVSLPERFKPL
jgi:hypothetical protein